MTQMNKERKRKRRIRALAKALRIITVAPFMALAAFTTMFLRGGVFNNVAECVAAVVFISVLPLTAYPLQKIIPPFKYKGRKGQRTLAMIMSLMGYIAGVIYALTAHTSTTLTTIFITYLLSGLTLFIINKGLRYKASGHACGIAGPVGVLLWFMGANVAGAITLIIGIALLAAALWSTLKTHAHTALQFVCGGIIPIIFFYTLIFI
ncbi:MAG: hypothetical protein IKL36_08475 [Clostridia bacterium]|nr:hypothetical protein [Clostridia bacterium]